MRVLLFEASPIDTSTGNPVTVQMCSADSPSTMIVDGDLFYPAIVKSPNRAVSITDDGFETRLSPIGFSVEANPGWGKLHWDGAQARVWIGEHTAGTITSFEQIFEGLLGSLALAGVIAEVEMRGNDALLNVDLLSASYAGTGGAEGQADMAGTLKPWASGSCQNIEPVLVSAQYQVYQYHGYGPTQAVDAVYENALKINSAGGGAPSYTVTTYAALIALTLTSGQWAACPELGMFRLANEPSGKLTADVRGAKNGVTYASTISGITQHLMALAGVNSIFIDTASIGTFTQSWNLYVTGQMKIGTAVREAFRQAGGYIFPNENGVFKAGTYLSTKTPGVLTTDTLRQEPYVIEVEQRESPPTTYRVKIGHSICWATHSPSDISPAVAELQDGVGAAQAAAEAAHSAANAAQADADLIAGIVDEFSQDGLLDRSEKKRIIDDLSRWTAEKSSNEATADNYSVTTEKTAYQNAYTALVAYLTGLSPAYTDFTQSTPIDRATFTSTVNAFTTARANLRNRIDAVAGALGSWNPVTNNVVKDGANYTKAGGTNGTYDAKLYSQEVYKGGAMVSFKMAATDKSLAVGLDNENSAVTNDTSIKYAFRFNSDATYTTYDDYGPTNQGSYTTTDIFQINYSGTKVYFLKNNTTLREVNVDSAQTLGLAAVFSHTGAGVKSLAYAAAGPMGQTGPTTSGLTPNSNLESGKAGWTAGYSTSASTDTVTQLDEVRDYQGAPFVLQNSTATSMDMRGSLISFDETRKYKLRATYYATGTSGAQIKFGIAGFATTSGAMTHEQTVTIATPTLDAWTDVTIDVNAGILDGDKLIAPFAILNSSNTTGATISVRMLKLEDVTESSAANDAANEAATSAGLAYDAQVVADTRAIDAAASEAAAAVSEALAGDAATTATTAAVEAEGQAGIALTHAATASTAASTAATQATISASHASGMAISLSDTFPKTFNPDCFSWDASGGNTASCLPLPQTVPSWLAPDKSYVQIPSGYYQNAFRGLVPVTNGDVFRLTADVEQFASAGALTSAHWYCRILDGNFNLIASLTATGGYVNRAEGVRSVQTYNVGYNAPGLCDYNITTGGAKYVRFTLLVNRAESSVSQSAGSVTRVHAMYLEYMRSEANALSSATAASTSATNASASSSTASSNATLSATYRDAAQKAATATMPSTFEDGMLYFGGNNGSANPGNMITNVHPTHGPNLTNSLTTTWGTVGTKTRRPTTAGKKWKVRALIGGAVSAAKATLALECWPTATGGTRIDTPSTSVDISSLTPTWFEYTVTSATDGYVCPVVLLNYPAPYQAHQRIYALELVDVDAVEKATAQANISTAQAAISTANAAAAQQSAVLSASIGQGFLTRNSGFDDYPSGSVGAYPTGWWSGGTGVEGGYRVADPQGGYGYRIPAPAATSCYVGQVNYTPAQIAWGGYYVIEADIVLNSGTLNGAGALFRTTNSAGTAQEDLLLSFSDDLDQRNQVPGAGVAGRVYQYRKLVKTTAGAPTGFFLYIMNHWSGFGSISAANDITWFKAAVRPATQAEIRDQTVLAPMEATVSSHASAISTLNTRTASYITKVSAGAGTAELALSATDSGGAAASTITLKADKIKLGTITAPVLEIASGKATFGTDVYVNSGRIVIDTGTHMKVQGNGFGNANQFIEWFGPKMAINLCSEANGVTWIKTNGQAYYGGGFASGALSNGGGSSGLSSTQSAIVGPFGTNGNPITVAVSWTYRTEITKSYAATTSGRSIFDADVATYGATLQGGSYYSGQTTATRASSTLELQRKIGSASYAFVNQASTTTETLSFSGNKPINSGDPGDATTATIIQYSSISFTYTDNAGGTQDRSFMATIARGYNYGSGTIKQNISINCTEG